MLEVEESASLLTSNHEDVVDKAMQVEGNPQGSLKQNPSSTYDMDKAYILLMFPLRRLGKRRLMLLISLEYEKGLTF